MRNVFAVALLSLVAGSACSAVDNFNSFKFPGGGGHGGSSGNPDMAPPQFGDACTISPNNCSMSLSCDNSVGTTSVPDNICTRTCSPGNSCADLPNGACIQVSTLPQFSGQCLVRCNGGSPCRSGFSCCTANAIGINPMQVQVCAPDGNNFATNCH